LAMRAMREHSFDKLRGRKLQFSLLTSPTLLLAKNNKKDNISKKLIGKKSAFRLPYPLSLCPHNCNHTSQILLGNTWQYLANSPAHEVLGCLLAEGAAAGGAGGAVSLISGTGVGSGFGFSHTDRVSVLITNLLLITNS
jgi:hypothetical protein